MNFVVKTGFPITVGGWGNESDSPKPDPSALETSRLFGIYYAPLFRYVRALGLARQECEEVIQETFLALFLHLRAERPTTNLAGWLFRVAHNLGLKRREFARSGPKALDAGSEHNYCDVQPNAEQMLLGMERSARLTAVVAALSEMDRQCLFLRAEGMKYREIGDALGISIGTVSTCLVRALDKLRRADESNGRPEDV